MVAGPPCSKLEAKLRREERRERQRAALLKRQVAAMEVSGTMLLRDDRELWDNILRGGPDVAPASSYEEVPASQHSYWADLLLLDTMTLQAPSVTAPGVNHAQAMATAIQLHSQPPGGGRVLVSGRLGSLTVTSDAVL